MLYGCLAYASVILSLSMPIDFRGNESNEMLSHFFFCHLLLLHDMIHNTVVFRIVFDLEY